MSQRQVKSLYCLIIIVLLLSGCTQNEISIVTHSPSPTSVPTEVVAQPVMESVATEPIVTELTVPPSTTILTTECKKIAFSEYVDSNSDIFTVCPDGSQLFNLTQIPSDEVNPAWSPDGRQLAFASAQSGHFQIYLMDEDGKNVTPVTNDYENQFPIWLPDGKQIAFRTDDGKGLFWWRVLNLENSELTTITDASFDFFYQTPAWSPDGQRIAYMSLVEQQERNDGSSQIHAKNVDGTNDVALTDDIWTNVNPKWSPDGSKIAFLSERGGTYNMFALYMMNSDGTDVQQLTETGYPDDVVYSWSPDGRQIVIGSNNLLTGITVVDINSKTSHPLMEWTTPANAWWPSWQP